MSLIEALRSLRRNSFYGAAEYYLRPGIGNRLGGPFNGQLRRREIFRELVERVGFDTVIECGTYRGSTTPFLQTVSGVDVEAVEADARFYGYCRTRFAGFPQIRMHYSDSRAALRRFTADSRLDDKRVFVYLDAHWRDDLPLAEEVQILFGGALSVVAMVDDFRVPSDPGYRYDDYGPGKSLETAYLDRAGVEGYRRFFPSASSEEETGRRRGCIVLASNDLADTVASCDTLREHSAEPSLRRVA